jgi:putative ABC transport system substrate-binding protein
LLSGTHFNPPEVEGIKKGLADTGFNEGGNIQIEYRSAEGKYDLLPSLASNLVHRRVAVIVTIGGAASAPAAKSATASIPIVFANGADPVKLGLVSSLNRPGGNVTGASFLVNSLSAKRMEMLHALIPSATSIGFLVNPQNPSHVSETQEVEAAAKALGQDLRVQTAVSEADIDAAFERFSQQHVAAVSVAADAYFLGRHNQIVGLVVKYKLPAIFPREEYVVSGGLVSYAPRPSDAYRLAGAYAGRILKGEKPSELPVQQSVRVYLTINLKAAKALGIDVPPTLLATADEVIE